ncbi:predicted protein [Streptomyces sp. C]|nr:predicted protein [Streptomyces sp. C]
MVGPRRALNVGREQPPLPEVESQASLIHLGRCNLTFVVRVMLQLVEVVGVPPFHIAQVGIQGDSFIG